MKKTAGQIIQENNNKNLELEDDLGAYAEAMGPEIYRNVYETAIDAAKRPLYAKKNFYVVLVKTVDRILKSIKLQSWARFSCPTPVYKQDVFKYHFISGELEYLWSIPNQDRYYDILHNKSKYLANKATSRLAQFVILMESGSLFKWVKKENGEKPDAVIMLNKREEH